MKTYQSSFQLIPNENDSDDWKIHIPIFYWLPKYKLSLLFSDLMAGITVGVMSIPQSMALAALAGVNEVHGLYVAMLAPMIYSIFGTSGQLQVSTIAITSIMSAESIRTQLKNMDEELHPDDYRMHFVSLSAMIAFQVGITQFVLGLLNAGLLANMLSHSVIIGFMAAASLIISMSQMKALLNMKIKDGSFINMLMDLTQNIANADGPTLILSLICIAILLIFKYVKSKYKKAKYLPGALFIVIFGTIVSYLTRAEYRFNIIGHLRSGFPTPQNFISHVSMSAFINLFPSSLLIALVGFIQSYAMAKRCADIRSLKVNASQELIALGACNMFVSWFTGIVGAGSFSRSAVAENVGSHTPLYSLITGAVISFSVLFLLPFFVFLPKCCLSCIVVVAVMNLFDYRAMTRLWYIKKKDFVVMLCTLCFTLVLDIEMGIAVGLIVSILMFVQSAANPSFVVLGRLQESNTFIDVMKGGEEVNRINECLIFRWDENLFFGNMEIFKTKIDEQIEIFLNSHHCDGNEWCLLLCCSSINDIDASAADCLKAFMERLKKKHGDEIRVYLSDIKVKPKDVMTRNGIFRNVACSTNQECIIKQSNIFIDVSQAVDTWIARTEHTDI